MKTAIIAASLALAASGGASANQTKAPQPEQKVAKEKLYCFTVEGTGSRIAGKVCKTKRQWRAEGVEVDSN